MIKRKLFDTYKCWMIRLYLLDSSSANVRQLRKFYKRPLYNHFPLFASFHREATFYWHEISLRDNHNRQSAQEKTFAFSIGALLTAAFIFFFGNHEVLCDITVCKDESQSKENSSPSSKDLKEREHKNNSKDDKSNLPNSAHQEKDLEEKNLPSLPFTRIKEPIFDNSVYSLKTAITKSRSYLTCKVSESGLPGIAISVSINGKLVWSEGIGFSDVENSVQMSPFSVMRIASISKSLTMVAICQLIEEGKLDIDAPIQKYIDYFPKKYVDGEEVIITTRHLLNHTSGIRHYERKSEKKKQKEKKDECNEEEKIETPNEEKKNDKIANLNTRERKKNEPANHNPSAPKPQKEKNNNHSEFKYKEYYIKEKFESTRDSVKLFMDDDLMFKPGEGFCYSTHGFTLVSAVIEGASGKKFPDLMKKIFGDLALTRTMLDQNDPIIIRRARLYRRDKRGKLKNAHYVDNSYKWAGGGFLSNVIDLNNFGNAMLYSYQNTEDREPKGFLKASTMREMWKLSPNHKINGDSDPWYGLGWGVMEEDKSPKAFAHRRRFCAFHSGGAIGASSVLTILPRSETVSKAFQLPQGVVVSIITNLEDVKLSPIALLIAKAFERVQLDDPNVLGTIGGNTKNKVYSLDSS